MACPPHTPEQNYIGVIADMVHSRELDFRERPGVQKRFTQFVASLNDTFRDQLAADFTITLGDEFQGLLWDWQGIPQLIRTLEQGFTDRVLRLGFGFGPLTTARPRKAINLDGPALQTARKSIETAKKMEWLGGVFNGFGRDQDVVLNGLARMLYLQRTGINRHERQRQIFQMFPALLTNDSQAAVARALGLSKQVVSKTVQRAGLETYRMGEDALSAMLALSCR